MQLLCLSLIIIVFLLPLLVTSAKLPEHRFQIVIERMADAINKQNYHNIQQAFCESMLKEFPLSKSKPFFRNLIARYGKIQKLGQPGLLYSDEAVFPAQFEECILDIKVVLDDSDKVTGLWFLPHQPDTPVPERHITRLDLPFNGMWVVSWGGDTRELNQHHHVPNQKYAFDFLRMDKNGQTYKNEGWKNEDYFAFGKEIMSPGDGVVTDVITGVRDNMPGSVNPYSASGNAVLIRHHEYEVSVIAHFKNDSIRVNVGDKVKRGQVLGLCGNSGNSSEPHIHFHLQNTSVLQDGKGIKCYFTDIVVSRDDKTQKYRSYSPIKNDIVKNK